MTDDRTPSWRRYLRFWRRDAAGDVNEEVSFHLDSTVDELVARGMSRDAARAAARRKFGDVDGISKTLYTLSRQRERTMARTEWMDALQQDVVFALRQLRKSPAFTLVTVLTLALGIGANSAIFSVVHSVLLQPLPYAHSDRILALGQRGGQNKIWDLPFGNYGEWQRQSTSFEAIAAWWGDFNPTLTGHGDPVTIATTRASAGYWKTLFIPPLRGRYYTEADDRQGAPPVAVASYAFWKNRFNGDAEIIGKTIVLDGTPVTIVGVAPPEYILRPPAEKLWMPLAPSAQRLGDFADHELRINALLKPGVTPEAAIREVTRVESELARAHPNSGYDGGVAWQPLVDSVVGPQRLRLYLLLGAVALVLLIACGNIANLLLARANVRRGEIAVRGALGATRSRIVVQLLVESALLGLTGGVLGLIVATIGMRFLVAAPAQIPRLQNASLNGPVLAFTFLAAVVCSMLFGLAPAIRAARLDLQKTLRDGGRESRGATRDRLRRVLVITELCIAQVLLIGAGLLIRSSLAVRAVPIGFDTDNLLATSLVLPNARYSEPSRVEATFQQMEVAIAAIPGVRSVGRTQRAPIYSFGYNWKARRENSDGNDDGAVVANMRGVTPTYFATLRLSVLRGRTFSQGDAANSPPVAMVSRSLAKRLYGDADPIGRRITNSGMTDPEWREIVGVVDDMHASGPKDDPPLELYIPSTQFINGGQTLLVRGAVPVATLVPAIRRAVASVDPLVALNRVATIEESLSTQLAMDRFSTSLLSLLGATGLLLSIVGVYGVVSYFVTQRTHEFGVRVALGSSGLEVQRLVVKQGLMLAVWGVVIGLGLSYVAARALNAMVFGITAHDPVTFVTVAGLLGGVAVLASYLPARRATRVDPMQALRSS
jgi:putative ABC transport system permease protein